MKRINSTTILAAYTLLTLVMTWPLAQNITTAIPGDGFDGWQNYWNLWWIKVALVDKLQHPFYTDILYAPTGVGLYFHTLNPFNGLITLPIQLSTGLIPAYNTVVLISWVLGGYGTYLLTLWTLRKITPPLHSPLFTIPSSLSPLHSSLFTIHSSLSPLHYPALIAGIIYTFAPFHMAHLLGHMQVMSLQWIPFYILYLLRALDRAETTQSPTIFQRHEIKMAALFLILTGLCDWYFVLYLFLFTGFVITWRSLSLIYNRKQISHILRQIAQPTAIGLIFCIVMSPLLIPMASQILTSDFMVRPATDLYILSASLMDFLVPNRLHTLFRPESFGWIGNQIAPVSERTISLGYVPLLLAIVALWINRRRAIFWLAVMLFFIILALGPQIHLGNIDWTHIPADADTALAQSGTPFTILNQLIPLMRISRSVSRYALMAQLALAVLAGIGIASIIHYTNKNHFLQSHQRTFYTITLFLILTEYWVAPYPLSPPDTPQYYNQLPSLQATSYQPPTTILNLPMNYDRPGYLLYQTVHQRPLAVAYISRDDPRTLTERAPVLQHFRHLGPDIIAVDPAKVGMTILSDLGIGQLILDRYKMPNLDSQERQYTTMLAQAIFADQAPAYEDDRLTVFDVYTPDEPMPYVVLGDQGWGPLQVDNENQDQVIRRRALIGDSASLDIHHGNAETRLMLRYRTMPGVTVQLIDVEQDQLIGTLPSAATATNISFKVGAIAHVLLQIDGIESGELADESVAIEQIGLE